MTAGWRGGKNKSACEKADKEKPPSPLAFCIVPSKVTEVRPEIQSASSGTFLCADGAGNFPTELVLPIYLALLSQEMWTGI